jgi:16S rRNA (uracil1498-N3)-methyltransferase
MQRLIVQPNQVTGEHLRLTPDQQHYLYRVLRLAVGDHFLALDGGGQQWMAELSITPGLAIATPLPVTESPSPPITLAIALPKGSGFDDVVRQTTELGVTTLQPVITERTLHHPNPKKLERWQRIAAEATEQSERLRVPTLRAPIPWQTYLHQPLPPQRWLCVARGEALPLLQVAQACDPLAGIVIALGPEGGWSDTEVSTTLEVGFQPVSLGPHILRAVTAPIAALAITMAIIHSKAAFLPPTATAPTQAD